MNNLTKSMDLISKPSRQAAAVLKSIDEIAFHTNILALNAAVESARAGEAGAGFSAELVEKTIVDVSSGVGSATVMADSKRSLP